MTAGETPKEFAFVSIGFVVGCGSSTSTVITQVFSLDKVSLSLEGEVDVTYADIESPKVDCSERTIRVRSVGRQRGDRIPPVISGLFSFGSYSIDCVSWAREE